MKDYKRVILVDDDVMTQEYNELILSFSELKSEILRVSSFTELSQSYSEPNAFHSLVILDMNLETENALELLEKMNKLDGYDPSMHDVIILSSAILLDYKEMSKSFPEIKKYVEKPLVLETISEFL